MKKLCISIFISFVLSGCAPKINYLTLQNFMANDNCSGSVKLLQDAEAKYGSKAKLLHLLDSGMINFQCSNYKVASKYFQDADELAQQLWTTSLSKETASFVTNDLIIPYRGEDFERALINLFSAFTYIRLGQYDEAMTDCRRLDTMLTEYNKKYKNKNVYKEDALGRYISGILSEADKEYSEAYIYYYEALRAYKSYNNAYGTATPQHLLEDILRVSAPADKRNEARSLIKNSKQIKYTPHSKARKSGKIVFIHLNGKGPVKIENKYTVATPEGPISMAFPKFVTTPPSCHGSKLILKSDTDNTYKEKAVLFEDINKIALKGLSDRKVRITAKTIARAVAKQVIVKESSKQIEKEYGPMAGLAAQIAGNIAASATEIADTRSWRTLPGEIYLTRSFVPAGNYQVSVENCNGSSESLDSINVKAGETKFIFHDTIY